MQALEAACALCPASSPSVHRFRGITCYSEVTLVGIAYDVPSKSHRFSRAGRRVACGAFYGTGFADALSRAMELITILNRCHHFRGFVYEYARFSPDKKSIEATNSPNGASNSFLYGDFSFSFFTPCGV